MLHVSEILCGPAVLKGPLDEDGNSLLRAEANLISGDPFVIIKCQLNRTDSNVTYTYNPRLNIFRTSDGHVLTKRKDYGVDEDGNYVFNISVYAELDKSIVTCGVDYRPSQDQGTSFKYCYTVSAALIILRDNIPCDTSTTAATSPETTPTTPSTTSSTVPSTTSTGKPPTTKLTTSSTKSTSMPNPTETRTPPATTTSQPRVDTDKNIAVKKETFFSVVSIAIVVGIILLVANGIQMWVIIIIVKNRKTTKAANVSATNGIALDQHGIEIEQHGIELDRGLESEDDTTIQNNTATESG